MQNEAEDVNKIIRDLIFKIRHRSGQVKENLIIFQELFGLLEKQKYLNPIIFEDGTYKCYISLEFFDNPYSYQKEEREKYEIEVKRFDILYRTTLNDYTTPIFMNILKENILVEIQYRDLLTRIKHLRQFPLFLRAYGSILVEMSNQLYEKIRLPLYVFSKLIFESNLSFDFHPIIENWETQKLILFFREIADFVTDDLPERDEGLERVISLTSLILALATIPVTDLTRELRILLDFHVVCYHPQGRGGAFHLYVEKRIKLIKDKTIVNFRKMKGQESERLESLILSEEKILDHLYWAIDDLEWDRYLLNILRKNTDPFKKEKLIGKMNFKNRELISELSQVILEESNEHVLALLIYKLSKFRPSVELETVFLPNLLTDPNPALRKNGLSLIYNNLQMSDLPMLRRMAETDPDSSVRGFCLYILGTKFELENIPVFLRALKDLQVRRKALEGLRMKKHRDRDLTDCLFSLLQEHRNEQFNSGKRSFASDLTLLDLIVEVILTQDEECIAENISRIDRGCKGNRERKMVIIVFYLLSDLRKREYFSCEYSIVMKYCNKWLDSRSINLEQVLEILKENM